VFDNVLQVGQTSSKNNIDQSVDNAYISLGAISEEHYTDGSTEPVDCQHLYILQVRDSNDFGGWRPCVVNDKKELQCNVPCTALGFKEEPDNSGQENDEQEDENIWAPVEGVCLNQNNSEKGLTFDETLPNLAPFKISLDDLDILESDYLEFRLFTWGNWAAPVWEYRLYNPVNIDGFWPSKVNESERTYKQINAEIEEAIGITVPVLSFGVKNTTNQNDAVPTKLRFNNIPVESVEDKIPDNKSFKIYLAVRSTGRGGSFGLHDLAGGTSALADCDSLENSESTLANGTCNATVASFLETKSYSGEYYKQLPISKQKDIVPEDEEGDNTEFYAIDDERFSEFQGDEEKDDYHSQKTIVFIKGIRPGTIFKDTQIEFVGGYTAETDEVCVEGTKKITFKNNTSSTAYSLCAIMKDTMFVSVKMENSELGSCDVIGKCMNGINLTNRNLSIGPIVDFSAVGPIPIAFTRSYNSFDSNSSPFGKGWTFNFQKELYLSDYRSQYGIEMKLIWKRPDGKLISFVLKSDQAMLSEQSGAILSETETYGHEFKWLDRHYVATEDTRYKLITVKNAEDVPIGDNEQNRAFIVYDAINGYAEVYEGDKPPFRLVKIVNLLDSDNNKIILKYVEGEKPDKDEFCPDKDEVCVQDNCQDESCVCPEANRCYYTYFTGDYDYKIHNIESITVNQGTVYSFVYDANNMISNISTTNGGVLASYTYSTLGDGDTEASKVLSEVVIGDYHTCYAYTDKHHLLSEVKYGSDAGCNTFSSNYKVEYDGMYASKASQLGFGISVKNSKMADDEYFGADLADMFVSKSTIVERDVTINQENAEEKVLKFKFDQQNKLPGFTENILGIVPRSISNTSVIYKATVQNNEENCRPKNPDTILDQGLEEVEKKYRDCAVGVSTNTIKSSNGDSTTTTYLKNITESDPTQNLSIIQSVSKHGGKITSTKLSTGDTAVFEIDLAGKGVGETGENVKVYINTLAAGTNVTVTNAADTYTDVSTITADQTNVAKPNTLVRTVGEQELNYTYGNKKGAMWEGEFIVPGPDFEITLDTSGLFKSVAYKYGKATAYDTGGITVDRTGLTGIALANGSPGSIIDNDTGTVQEYSYHSSGIVKKVEEKLFGGTDTIATSEFDSMGRMTNLDYNGIKMSYTYPVYDVDAQEALIYKETNTDYEWMNTETTINEVSGLPTNLKLKNETIELAYAYDEYNNVLEVQRDGTSMVSNVYSNNGTQLDSVFAGGIQTKYKYIESDGIIKHFVSEIEKGSQDSGLLKVEYAYDIKGALKKVTSAEHDVKYDYDDLGRLSKMNPKGLDSTTYTYVNADESNCVAGTIAEMADGKYTTTCNAHSGPHAECTDISNSDGSMQSETKITYGTTKGTPEYGIPTLINSSTTMDGISFSCEVNYSASYSSGVMVSTSIQEISLALASQDGDEDGDEDLEEDGDDDWEEDGDNDNEEETVDENTNAVTGTDWLFASVDQSVTQPLYQHATNVTIANFSSSAVSQVEITGDKVNIQSMTLTDFGVIGTFANTGAEKMIDLGAGGLQGYTSPISSRGVSYSYDTYDHLTGITNNTCANETYTNDISYDETFIGHVKSEDVHFAGNNLKYEYSYDDAGRLSNATCVNNGAGVTEYTIKYSYEEDNSLSGVTVENSIVPGLVSTTFSRSSGYKVTSSAHSVVYDSTGRVTQFGNKSFSYDARGRLWKVVSPDETTKYYYDSSGMRVVKDYVLNDEDDADIRRVITRYVYSGSNLVAERIQSYSDVEGQNAVKREERNYFWLGMRPVAMGINSYNMIGGLFVEGTWKEYDIVTDRTGRPVMVVNSIMNKVWSTKYTPYGISYGAYSGSGFEFNLRQPGQYFDSETGFYYNGQRYYIPEMRRYNRPEPIGQAGSLDLYMYAGGNPVMKIDPTGLWEVPQWMIDVAGWFGYVDDTIKENATQVADTVIGNPGAAPPTASDKKITDFTKKPNVGTNNLLSTLKWMGHKAAYEGTKLGAGEGMWAVATVGAGWGISKFVRQLRYISPVFRLHQHHIFPVKYRKQFGNIGIDIDDFTVDIDASLHLKGVHGKGGEVLETGEVFEGYWNQKWGEWWDLNSNNPNITKKDAQDFAEKLMGENSLLGHEIHPYGK